MPLPDMIKHGRFWVRLSILLFYFAILCVILPVLILQAIRDGLKKGDHFLTLIGGIFVLLTLPMSVWLIIQHMMCYSKPKLQKHIIRILWMVPIYSLNAWFSLLYPDSVMLLDGFRECYEAYVIYSFMMFLFNYLHENFDDLDVTLRRKPQTAHIFPLCFLDNWKMGRELVHNCKHGILQYTVVRPLLTLFGVLCSWNEVVWERKLGYFVIMVINNLSQFTAMYCLVLFYRATKEELAPMRPIGKFLCIKAVIFFSFFQGVIINILVFTGVIKALNTVAPVTNITKFEVNIDPATFIQNFLLCFEMFIAAIAHHYSFSVDEFARDLCHGSRSWKVACRALWDFSDVGADIKEHLGFVGTSLSKHIRPRIISGKVSGAGTGAGNEESTENKSSEVSPLLDAQNAYDFKEDHVVTHRDVTNSVVLKASSSSIC